MNNPFLFTFDSSNNTNAFCIYDCGTPGRSGTADVNYFGARAVVVINK